MSGLKGQNVAAQGATSTTAFDAFGLTPVDQARGDKVSALETGAVNIIEYNGSMSQDFQDLLPERTFFSL